MNLPTVPIEYVGLVTGVTLAEAGHYVTCVDIDVEKIRRELSPFYEPNLAELMKKNIEAKRLTFIWNHEEGFLQADNIYLAAEILDEDRFANLAYVEYVATTIALTAKKDTIVVTKSTVPAGTNDRLLQIIGHNKLYHINIEVVSNPELLIEVSAIYAYTPNAVKNAKKMLAYAPIYVDKIEQTIENVEAAFVLTGLDKPHLQASLGSW